MIELFIFNHKEGMNEHWTSEQACPSTVTPADSYEIPLHQFQNWEITHIYFSCIHLLLDKKKFDRYLGLDYI